MTAIPAPCLQALVPQSCTATLTISVIYLLQSIIHSFTHSLTVYWMPTLAVCWVLSDNCEQDKASLSPQRAEDLGWKTEMKTTPEKWIIWKLMFINGEWMKYLLWWVGEKWLGKQGVLLGSFRTGVTAMAELCRFSRRLPQHGCRQRKTWRRTPSSLGLYRAGDRQGSWDARNKPYGQDTI